MSSLSPAMVKQLQDLRMADDYVRLKQLCQRLLPKAGDTVIVNAFMGQCLRNSGDFKTALFYTKRACELEPKNAELQYELGFNYWKLGQLELGTKHARESIRLNPHAHHTQQLHIKLLEELSKYDEMAEAAEEAIKTNPSDPKFYCARSLALATAGRADEASLKACQSLLDFPSLVDIAELACFCHNYVSGFTRQRVFEVHSNYGRLMAQTAPIPPAKVHTNPDPDRQIRIGFLSTDLRQHSVAYFIEPFFRHYDKKRFHVRAFACGAPFDAVAKRLSGLIDGWHPDAIIDHVQMAEAVRATGMDIIVDLNGITQGHRMHSMFLRCAPVQATYIGYPNTTGVPGIDYRIVDSLTDPAEPPISADRFATEKLVRIDPCFLCYEPRIEPGYPEPGERPERLPDGSPRPIVFGSFNATFKINDQIISLWRRVIEAVPGSKLVIKSAAIRDQGMVESIRRSFARNGFDLARLDVLHGTNTTRQHLETYQGIDIGLDTYPYHGTTTTCEAMSMGVPVIVLVGESHASRVGLSLLTNVGLPELATKSEDEFVAAAVALCNDRPRLAQLQRGLRAKLLASPLCDATAYADRLSRAFIQMWHQYCHERQVSRQA